MKNDRIKIATLQVKVSPDKEKNLQELERILDREELQEADMALLPEMFNCPYKTTEFPLYAEEEQGETWRLCSRLARSRGIYLSAGSIPERDSAGNIYNTAYVFDRQGRQIAKHRKAHLFDISVSGGQHFKESDTLKAGDGVTVFHTEFCKMGLCICYDFRFPELARLMSLEGARVILVPAAFNMTTGPAHWETMFRQRAVDNQVFTVGTAPARDAEGCYVSWGHSIVADPWGNVVMEMDEKEGIRITELDLRKVERVRGELPLLAHRRTDLYEVRRRGASGRSED